MQSTVSFTGLDNKSDNHSVSSVYIDMYEVKLSQYVQYIYLLYFSQ